MSRIHEALRKAEQERAATQGGVLQPGLAPVAVPNPAAYSTPPLDEIPESAAAPPMPSALGSSGPEAMLAQCAHLEWKPDLSKMLFMNGNDHVTGAEEYRTLRSRLYSLREQMKLQTLLITSALPQEGKSFTASNLAQVLVRQHGRRVLLIDGDLRGPRLHLMLGTTQGPGLSDYLKGQNDEFSILQRGDIENLYFIPSGQGIEDPAELVGGERLKTLIQRLETLFDWIIVDSPPALQLADASLLGKACDGVLMVVRSNSTPADVARKACMEFPKQSMLGVVLNGTHPESEPYARYYYEAYEKRV
jgi:protein-tyrosine kinase